MGPLGTTTGGAGLWEAVPGEPGQIRPKSAPGYNRIALGDSTPVTADRPLILGSQTWDNALQSFHLLDFIVTNTASAATSYLARFRVNGDVQFSVDKSGNVVAAGTVSLAANKGLVIQDNGYVWSVFGPLTFVGSSNFVFTNAAGSGLSGLVCFGGPFSTFPGLKRVGTALHLRLADDSDYTDFAASWIALVGGTATSSTPIIEGSQTWNNALATFYLLDFSVTNTASVLGSRLLRFRVDSDEVFAIDHRGAVTARLGYVVSPSVGVYKYAMYGTSLELASDARILWSPGPSVFGVLDLGIVRSGSSTARITDGASGYGALQTGPLTVVGDIGTYEGRIDLPGGVPRFASYDSGFIAASLYLGRPSNGQLGWASLIYDGATRGVRFYNRVSGFEPLVATDTHFTLGDDMYLVIPSGTGGLGATLYAGLGGSSLRFLTESAGAWQNVTAHSLGLDPAGVLRWGDLNPEQTIDLGIGRTSTGVGEVNSGVLGTLRDLRARNFVGLNSDLSPTFSFSGDTGTGIGKRVYSDSNRFGFITAGGMYVQWIGSTSLGLASGLLLAWYAASPIGSSSIDAALGRPFAGCVQVTNGSGGHADFWFGNGWRWHTVSADLTELWYQGNSAYPLICFGNGSSEPTNGFAPTVCLTNSMFTRSSNSNASDFHFKYKATASDIAAYGYKMTAQAAWASASTNIIGGNISLIGGAGASGSAGAAHGGHVFLDGGEGFGTGLDGDVQIGATRGMLRFGTYTADGAIVPTGYAQIKTLDGTIRDVLVR